MQENVQPDTLRDCQKGELDFVFCEVVPYKGTAPEQKTKSAKPARLCGFYAFPSIVFTQDMKFFKVFYDWKRLLFINL